jgi:MFS family permease
VFSYGFIQPISFAMLAENLPVSQRGKLLSLVGLNYGIGEVIATALSLLILNGLEVCI